MKYIVVKGNNNPVTPATIKEVCSLLPPEAIFKVSLTEAKHIAISEVSPAEYEGDSTYIVKVGDKKLLLQPGPVSELHVPIPALINLLDDLGMDIHFVVFAIDAYEKLNGYCSLDDLEKFSRHINT